MMKKLCTALAVGSLALGATAGVAGAAAPNGAGTGAKPAGATCLQAGVATLNSLGLVDDVARGGIEVVGIGVLPFKTVLEYHRTSPELFQSGTGVSVVVGDTIVPATWCDA
jgi:hypothetical protein